MEDVIAGRYELGPLIGTGGNGRVFAARDRVLDRIVALKLVDAEAVRHRDPAGRERFLDEARSSAGFTHPNAVAVFDAGEADGSLYLVMELVEGPTLAERLATGGPMDPVAAAKVAADVLSALEAAHRAGIIHRDVKPANVLIDGNGTAKLADFGIAKRLDSVAASLTSPGQFFGTPQYLAPEQVEGRPVSAATDVYATGIMLFEMVTGRPPFDEGQPMATAMAQREAPVPDLRTTRPDVPDVLVAIIERALRKSPDERFESAEAMRRALNAPLWPAPPAADGGKAAPPAAARHAAGDATTVMDAGQLAPTSVLTRPASPPTAVLPRSASSPFPDGRRRSGITRALAIGLVVIAVAAAALAIALRDRSSNDPQDGPAGATVPVLTTPAETTPAATVAVGTSPPATAAPATAPAQPVPAETAPAQTVPAETAPPQTVPATTMPATPSDIPTLIDFLAPDPSVAGEQGESLLAGLQEVAERDGKKQREAAGHLATQVEEWTRAEKLDRAIGTLAQQLLERVAGPDGKGGGG